MTIQVEISGTGELVEFPDNTSPEEIQAAMQAFAFDAPPAPDAAQSAFETSPALGGSKPSGAGEATLAIATGTVADPIAGWVGIVSAPFVGVDGSIENMDAVRQLIQFAPDPGSAGEAQLQSIGSVVQPVASAFESGQQFLGNAVLDATGSPELAAISHTLPTAALEAMGVKGLRNARKLDDAKLSGSVAKAIQQAAPDVETIKTLKKQAYAELDQMGIKIKPEIYDSFVDRVQATLEKEGLNKVLTPKSKAALDQLIEAKGTPKTMTEMDTLRKVAKAAANDIDKTDARLGNIIIAEIDDGLDALATQIGGKFKEARALAQRSFKSETIIDMIENASHTASGMENGLRIEARKLLKSKKRLKGYTPDEIKALKAIEQGTTSANIAKFLGKFGISEGQATSMLGASIGMGGGGTIGAVFGGPAGAGIGAVTVPAIGQIAKKTAQRITKGNTEFADALARSGKDAKKIAEAYLENTPRSERRVSDLTDLFLQEGVTPESIKALRASKTNAYRVVQDSLFWAGEVSRKARQATGATLILQPNLTQEEAAAE